MPMPLLSLDFQPHVVWKYLFNPLILQGARTTIIIALLAQTLGVALGLLSALMRMSKNPLVSTPANFYVWFFRGTPLLIQLLIWFVGVPELLGGNHTAVEVPLPLARRGFRPGNQ